MLHYHHCAKAAMASSASAILYGMVEVRLLVSAPRMGECHTGGTKQYFTEQTSAMPELLETKGKFWGQVEVGYTPPRVRPSLEHLQGCLQRPTRPPVPSRDPSCTARSRPGAAPVGRSLAAASDSLHGSTRLHSSSRQDRLATLFTATSSSVHSTGPCHRARCY